MKIFFWVMWCAVLSIELFLLKGLLGMIFHKYNPINMSSVVTTTMFLILGAGLLSFSYYFYHAQKMKLACGIASLPLIAIVLYFFAFLILPYLMDERMN